MTKIRLSYYDLDNIIEDIKELSNVLCDRCNILKRETESERSIGYSLLEDYFYNLNKFLKDNQSYITTNLNDINGIKIKSDNIFNKVMLNK